jgi:UDP-GlcNAc:undecaprenyl-phosphate GlcNAc-1-phosphate transferase
VLRIVSGRGVAQGGRDHSSHRLVAVGLSERWALGVLWTLAALAGVIGYMMTRSSLAIAAAALFVIAMILFAVFLGYVRVVQGNDRMLSRSGTMTPFVVDFMYKRRVAEVMLDVCLVSLSYYAAYRLRFDGDQLPLYFDSFLRSLPVALGVQMVAFFVVGVYRGVWRLFGLMDGVVAAKGVAALVTEHTPRTHVGTALTLQTSAGFLLTLVSMRLVPPLVSIGGWKWAFVLLAPGPLLGAWAMKRLVVRGS